jgi:hypothetical protein
LDFVNSTTANGTFIYEKTLEAWIMAHAGQDSDSGRVIADAIGCRAHIANTINTIYVKFMDVLTYDASPGGPLFCSTCGALRRGGENYEVVELKRDKAKDEAVSQVQGYIRWAKEVLAGGDEVTGHVIARGFSNSAIEAAAESGVAIRLHKYVAQADSNGVRMELTPVS